ncbi:MAG TPA: DUF2085 domain-containing protein [Thermomicrobiales bacterium]|nr:DUF2085 domain-containing protein [Thermomicrobiales bacterium]
MHRSTTADRRGHRATAVLIRANRAVYRIARHWLFLTNLMAAPFALLPMIAPVLAATGHGRMARPMYALFAPICHQQDDRSFHVLGEKTACCHRCLAVYGGLFVLGLLYVVARRRIPPASASLVGLLGVPIVIDVLTQPILQRESTPWLRVLTGALFALALAWAILPRLERGFDEMIDRIEGRFRRLVAEGRARPLLARTASTSLNGRP